MSDPARVAPKPPKSRRAPPAPTWAEMDAVIRAARATKAPRLWPLLATLRCTGLRVGEAIALEVRDLVLDAPVPTITVRTGKVAAHRGRVVPLAPVLVPILGPLVDGLEDTDRVFGRAGPLPPQTMNPICLNAEAEGLRPAVWRPEGRLNRRTSHLFRAGFQRGMRRAVVEDRAIDELVGHKGGSVRDAYYDGVEWAEAVDAVRLVPAIDMVGASATAGGQVVRMPGR